MRRFLYMFLFILFVVSGDVSGQVALVKSTEEKNEGELFIPTIPPEIMNKLQQPNPVLLFEECALIAINTSFSVRDAELELKRRNYGYISETANLRSKIDLNMLLPEYTQETKEDFNDETLVNDYFSVKTNEQNGVMSFTQPLASNGSLSGNITVNRFKQEDSDTEYTNRLNVNFIQPLFTANELQINIYRSKLNLDKSTIDYVGRRIGLIYGREYFGIRDFGGNFTDFGRLFGGGGGRDRSGSLSQYYYSAYRDTRLFELARDRSELLQDLVATAQRRMDEGNLPESEFLKIRIEASGSDDALYSAQSGYNGSKRQLVQFLGFDADIDFEVIKEMPYEPITIDHEKAVALGVENDIGIRNFKIDIELDSLNIILRRSDLGHSRMRSGGRLNEFSGGLSASLGVNKTDDIYRLYYDDFNHSQALTLNLAAPVWDWGRSDMVVEAAEVEYDKKKRQLQNDILDTERQVLAYLYTFDMIKEQIELIGKARDSARRGLEIARNQFEEGAISGEDLILAVNRDYQAKREYLRSFIDYKNALIRLANQTQWDYENNKGLRTEIEQLIESII
ncbi:TolC family protein [candidate division KSB1 bacterium]